MEGATVLEIESLHKRYGDVVALDDCSFDVPRGTLLGFLGPNGAGKTTAMRTVFGLVRPDSGRVRWDGAAIDSDVRLRFGYMPEQRGLYQRMKIHDQLVYFGRLHGMTRPAAQASATRWLGEFGLSDRADSRLEALSHGNQQRVQLAAAMVHEPELLVLDEPFSGLDPIGVEAMAGILQRQAADGVAVVFSSHQLDIVEDLCDDVIVVNKGKVVLAGAVADLRSRSPRRYLDVDTAGGDTAWAEGIAGSSVVMHDGSRIRLSVDADLDLAAVVAAASAAGEIRHFSFEPPNLSEVFREAVGQ
jgi:ABC-2 type transport system ATP-binding protein